MTMKVFVGGLPWAVDDARLKKAFEEFGPVVEAVVVIDKDTGKSRGFGFVTFEENNGAEKAIEQGEFPLDGRNVRVDRANDKRRGSDGGRSKPEPVFEDRRSGRRHDRQRGNGRDR